MCTLTEKISKPLKIVHIIGLILFFVDGFYFGSSAINQNPVHRHICEFLLLFSLIFILPYIFVTPIWNFTIFSFWQVFVKEEWDKKRMVSRWRLIAGGFLTVIYLLVLIIVPISMRSPSFARYVMDIPPLIVGNYLVLEGTAESNHAQGSIFVDGVEARFNQRNFRTPREGNNYTFIVAPHSMTVLDIIDEHGLSRRSHIR